jgi:MFS family permease
VESAANVAERPLGHAAERRLMLVVAAVVFVDTMFYAAIAPLLPRLAHELHLSKLSAGVMTAGYPLGTLAGALPGGVLAARAGPKQTVYVGLGLLAVSTLAFGLLENVVALDIARFLEGVGGAFSWAGGLAWLVAESPPSRRGSLIGGALGAAVVGELVGPVIGTIASAIGRAPAFSGVVALSLVLIDQVRRVPVSHPVSGQGLRQLQRAIGGHELQRAIWLVTLPAVASGMLTVLGPLRLHDFGATAALIGAAFLAAAACEAPISPLIGRLSDRRGRLLPIRVGLACATVLLACFTVPQTTALLALLIVVLTCTLGAFWAPALALLADAAEAAGLDQGLAAALMNLAWGVGVVLGSGGSGAIAKAAGDAVPAILIAALCAVTLLGLARPGRAGGAPVAPSG